MVEGPEITYTGSVNNAETICTVRPLQETIEGRAYASRLYAAARFARTQRFKDVRRRGTDPAFDRSVTAEPASCIVSDFEWDRVQPNTSFWAEEAAQYFLKPAIVYALIARLLMQIATEVFPFLGLWHNRTVCGGS
jgi:hypothetical protein